MGSTIGNFTDADRLTFLQGVARAMNPEDRFLLGLDMLKSPDLIEAAYNDSQGVTAAFNKNILANLNRSFNADFNMADFEHRAVFVKEKARVEMHLRATRATGARIADLQLSVSCREGRDIRTEICKKFSRATAQRDFTTAGLVATGWFQDPQGWFSLVMLKKARGAEADDLSSRNGEKLDEGSVEKCRPSSKQRYLNSRRVIITSRRRRSTGNTYDRATPTRPVPGKAWPAIIILMLMEK